ncbi:MAG: hypothetical protein CBB68_12480 [Rhodospirillaceae bacterium TMED8]|nr:hypothetical protein [Magnetovibrio sp.]OUT48927.1 MAG: hypothetical protein CBB68_12480 [Rhodospirillaceae bacterium TMED8]
MVVMTLIMNACEMQLDHVVINVKFGMDEAARRFKTLGFVLTPKGRHSLGSINHLMIFGTNYLELIGLPVGEITNRRDILKAPVGLNGLVFKTDNVDKIYTHLKILDMAGDPPLSFSRPIELGGVEHQVRFRTVTVRPDVFPAGRVYFCEHRTPEFVWRPEWQGHANGVRSIPEIIVVADPPGGQCEKFAQLLGIGAVNGVIKFKGGQLSIMSSVKYAERYKKLASPFGQQLSMFGGISFSAMNRSYINHLDFLDCNILVYNNRTLIRLDALDTVLEFCD